MGGEVIICLFAILFLWLILRLWIRGYEHFIDWIFSLPKKNSDRKYVKKMSHELDTKLLTEEKRIIEELKRLDIDKKLKQNEKTYNNTLFKLRKRLKDDLVLVEKAKQLQIEKERKQQQEEVENKILSIYNRFLFEKKKTSRRFNMSNKLLNVILPSLFVLLFVALSVLSFVFLSDDTCYTTATGKCYHSANCQYLSYSSYSTTISEAKNRGYRACSKCTPSETKIPSNVVVIGFFPYTAFAILAYKSIKNKHQDSYNVKMKAMSSDTKEKLLEFKYVLDFDPCDEVKALFQSLD